MYNSIEVFSDFYSLLSASTTFPVSFVFLRTCSKQPPSSLALLLSDELLAPGEYSPHSFRLLPLSCCSGGPSSQVPTKTALRSAVRPVPVDAALLRPVHSLPATIQPRFNFVQLSSNLSLRFTLVFLVRCFLCHLPPLGARTSLRNPIGSPGQ